MIAPILFVDEKEDENDKSVKRYEILKELIYASGYQDMIDFVGDLEMKSVTKENGEIGYLTNTLFNERKLVFIHASKNDDNQYPSDMVDSLRPMYPNIVFVEFSGSAKRNLDIRDLRFRRKEDIYKDGGYKVLLFIAYFKKYGQFAFDILIRGENLLESYDVELNEVKANLKSLIDELYN